MADGAIRRKALVFLGVFILLFLISSGTCLFLLRLKSNDIEILQNYRLQPTETAKASAEEFSRLLRERFGLSMRKASSRSHLFLKLAASAEEAEKEGFSLQELQDGGFLIAHRGNTLYLLARTEEGLRRACYRLAYRLTDEEGRLLLALDEQDFDKGSAVRDEIFIGDVPIEAYSIARAEAVPLSCAYDLAYYITQSCGALPGMDGQGDGPSLRLKIDKELSKETYRLEGDGGELVIKGADEASLALGIRQFANTYLCWQYAGTEKETLSGSQAPLHIPAGFPNAQAPWIEEREAIVTLWKVNFNRGVSWNNATSLKNDVLSFSGEQLYEYARMLKFCGFTGIQATDMCAAWAGEGGYSYVHERLRILADAAHSLDMKFTLWVWGAEFNDFGWVDNSAAYAAGDYAHAYENPDVLAAFEKYYSIYAQLADCCDRVIAHYYDPGKLQTAADVAFFAKMLAGKFRAANPDIDFGVSCWVDRFDKYELLRQLGSDITLYEGGRHDNPEDYVSFRGFCAESGCRLGTWAWNTCEMEIDQLAQMNFNPHIIQSVYQTAMQYDGIRKPEYWSEMDSYHVLNVFSLYCAGQLLIDPSRDPEQLTLDVAYAAVGKEYAQAFADVLKLIEDARSGTSWETYWWSSDEYLLKSDTYPAAEILARSERALALLQEMADFSLEANTLPLPLPLSDVLRLMMPHIRQIKAFAEFRIELSNVAKALADGAPREALQEKVNTIGTPIPEYNAVIGIWGQVEARAQQELLWELCEKYGLEMPRYPAFDRERKFRIYSEMAKSQKGNPEPVYFQSPSPQSIAAYGAQTADRLVKELVEEGILETEAATGALYLADWERYCYAFH